MNNKPKKSKFLNELERKISAWFIGLSILSLLSFQLISNATNDPDGNGWHDMKTELRAAAVDGYTDMFVGWCIFIAGSLVATGISTKHTQDNDE